MNRLLLRLVAGVLVLALFTLVTSLALAQSDDYDLSWWTIDDGGGTWQGGDYTLNGTAGQSDAAFWQGGGYTLAGGFWGGAAADSTGHTYLPIIMK